MKTLLLVAVIGSVFALRVSAQENPRVRVDADGVMRWTDTGAEVALFGVNYTTPFAHAFRAHRRLGIPWRQAIDADVYHFARLGFDAYRVHVWDREISDAAGNLVVNEHVEAFDYLLAKLKARGIKSVITPLQFGNAGYPEPGVPLDGFSSQYGKRGCLEDRASWPLQERYLAQLAAHVNPLTGVAYAHDPDIIAWEICNEPGHFDYRETVDYINRMVHALRDAGVSAPIFYNMSHGLPVFAAYLDAEVQGGTFQWYPAGLLANHEQRGNFLPYVDEYPIPFAADPRFRAKAKIVYEFDAADIGRAYLYPAMARTFRTAGMQFAAQFAYDPLGIAPFNTEYQTHYVNLAYAPATAIGLKIAGEAFRRVPRGKSYGAFPASTTFEGVRVSYTDDLAELVTDESFFHSNTTTSQPPHPERLTAIAGFGSSAVVSYPGQGAYFLDRLDPGVWRLEVMPDAIPVRDHFEKSSPHKHVTRISWGAWPMRVQVPDLGPDFVALGLNDGNTFRARAEQGTITVAPGAYLLTRSGVNTAWDRDDTWHNLVLKEFVAPPASIDRTYVLHEPVRAVTAGQALRIVATVVAPTPVEEVRLIYYPAETYALAGEAAAAPGARGQPGRFNQAGTGVPVTGGAESLTMEKVGGLAYAAEIPARQVQAGTLRYHVAVRCGETWTTLPADVAALPTAWDFYGDPWIVRVLPERSPVLLFDASVDAAQITAQGRDVRPDLVASERPGTVAIKVVAPALDGPEHDFSFRYFFRPQVRARQTDVANARRLVLFGRSANEVPERVQLALITADGVACGGMVTIEPQFGAYAVPIGDLRPVRSPNIPHGYPVFIPFWSTPPAAAGPLDMERVESVLVSIGPGMAAEEFAKLHAVLIERIWLE